MKNALGWLSVLIPIGGAAAAAEEGTWWLVRVYAVLAVIALGAVTFVGAITEDPTGPSLTFRWPEKRLIQVKWRGWVRPLEFWVYDPHDPELYEHALGCDGKCS